MQKFALGLLSAAAVAMTVLLVRQQKEADPRVPKLVTGEPYPTQLSIERIRELGL